MKYKAFYSNMKLLQMITTGKIIAFLLGRYVFEWYQAVNTIGDLQENTSPYLAELSLR